MTTSTREEITVGEMTIRFLVEGEQSAGSVAVFEFDVPAGAKVAAAHSHDGYEGRSTGSRASSAGRSRRQRPTALVIPRGAVHHFDNTGDVDAKALAIVTPGFSAPTSSARSRPSSTPRRAVRPTSQRSARSCAGTASPPHPDTRLAPKKQSSCPRPW